jgi:uncharacterized protein (TIGR03118 family)
VKSIYKIGIVVVACLAASAQNPATNSYTQTNLVSDLPGMAVSTDPHLVNPWGLSRPASATLKEAHWWAADQATGLSTLYDANGTIDELTVTIPPASGTGTGSPTGTVAVGGNFVFVTLDGAIAEWLATTGPPRPNFSHASVPAQACTTCHTTSSTIMVNNSSQKISYTGVTLVGSTLYVAASTGVEAYTTSFTPVKLGASAFKDPNVPAGYTPFGIQSVGKTIYVTFSPPAPATGGYVDAFSTAGKLLLTLQNGNWFDEPWGIAEAPANFGAFSGDVLVGNTGSGQIAAFNPTTGAFQGLLENSSGQPIANPGLWAIYFGAGNTQSGPVNTLYFNAGIDNFTHGLFGAIAAN